MTALDQATGLLLCAAALGPLLLAAQRVRRRFFADWEGVEARLVEAVTFATLLLVALEIAGLATVFGRWGIVATTIALGAAVCIAVGSQPRVVETPGAPTGGLTAVNVLAVVGGACLVATWGARVAFAYGHGMPSIDTLWYHLPVAARFVQDGAIGGLHYLDYDPVTVFYPANGPLYHAFGLAVFGNDTLSPLLNLLWLALALTAGWAIGKRFDRAPHCLIAVTVVMLTPGLVDTQPAGGYTDVMTVALFLAAAAILLADHRGLPAVAVAASAAAIAVGTKFTMLAPVGVLFVGSVLLVPKAARLRAAAVWGVALLTCGGYWYIRNLVEVGNPLPSLDLSAGPLNLPSAPTSVPTFTVAEFVTDPDMWPRYFIPGLRRSLGLAWWAVLGLAAYGALAAAFARRDAVVRLLGWVSVLGAVAYLVTPQFLGLPGAPIFFWTNVRYAVVAIVVGLVLSPTRAWFRSRVGERAWLVAAAAMLVALAIDPAVWPTGIPVIPFDDPVRGAAVYIGLGLGACALVLGLLLLARPSHPSPRIAVVGAGALSVAALIAVASTYATHRYAHQRPFPRTYAWAQDLRDQRMGIVGFVQQYPLYGQELSNHVQYLSASAPHGGVTEYSSCPEWVRGVNDGRYDWLVLAPRGAELAPVSKVAREATWSSRAGAELAFTERVATGALLTVFRVPGTLRPEACASRARPLLPQ